MGQLVAGQIHDLRQLHKGLLVLQRRRVVVDQIIDVADVIVIDNAAIGAFQQTTAQTGLQVFRKLQTKHGAITARVSLGIEMAQFRCVIVQYLQPVVIIQRRISMGRLEDHAIAGKNTVAVA